jgi:hypothetical protein
MDPDGILALFAVLGIGTMALIGLKMVLNYRATRLGSGAGSKDVERLTETIDQLRDHVDAQRQELTELHERVDFAERMLAKTRGEEIPHLGRPRQ